MINIFNRKSKDDRVELLKVFNIKFNHNEKYINATFDIETFNKEKRVVEGEAILLIQKNGNYISIVLDNFFMFGLEKNECSNVSKFYDYIEELAEEYYEEYLF